MKGKHIEYKRNQICLSFKGFTVDCHIIIFKYLRLSHKFDTTKKIRSLGNGHDIADQISEQNDDYSPVIPRVNLRLKQMSIRSYHNKHLMWS